MAGSVFIRTFGCVQNKADTQRILAYFQDLGYKETDSWQNASLVVINTCVVRESAENRAYGLIDNIDKYNKEYPSDKKKIVLTGCLVGIVDNITDLSKRRKAMNSLKKRIPQVDSFLPISKISYQLWAKNDQKQAGMVVISSGCNNYCSFCIVPFSRGKERSRPFEEILKEVDRLILEGVEEVVLIGQNVNSYGSDLVGKQKDFMLPSGTRVRPVMVKNMGKNRMPTLFPFLLEEIAKKELTKVSFVSSNPWDFSDELIEVIARYKNIDRLLHLPIQSGDNQILKKMNRGYTKNEYLRLIEKIRKKVKGVRFSTDIIVGFPGEDQKAFKNTVEVCKRVGFEIGYINKYSQRNGTLSARKYLNDVSSAEKKKRWKILNQLINIKTL